VEKSFKEWLDVLGYAKDTVYNLPVHVRELLHYAEEQGKSELHHLTRELIRDYYQLHLKQRTHQKQDGALSSAHLNKHLQALYKFSDYLRQSGKLILAPLQLKREDKDGDGISVLTEAEVKQLYHACEQYPVEGACKRAAWFFPALALRDKAMLTIYYGCGLRRNEGLHIDLNDVLWDKQLLYVRKGKNYKERFVPISKAGVKHLETYLFDARPLLIKGNKDDAFFINERGKRMQGQMMLLRLNQLVRRTENEAMLQKDIGLHTLRHSIATHLLGNGMQLEKIKDFLGHSSLESTQIYTHLTKQDE